MKLTVVLAVLFGTLILACSSADVPSADPTPNVNATVEARVDQERAVDTSIKANTYKYQGFMEGYLQFARTMTPSSRILKP
jgi:hypothetical protein